MKLREIMKRQPLTVEPDDSLGIATDLFVWTGSRHLPVVADGRCVGILSERDMLRYRAESGDADWRDQPIERAMSAPSQTAHPDDSLTEAVSRLAHDRIGCLPITDKGELVGLVTVTDLLAAEVQRAMSPRTETGPTVADCMTRSPATVKPGDSLLDAAGRMQSLQVRHLPVVDGDGDVVGMLSDRDVRVAIGDPALALEPGAERARIEGLRVSAAMSQEVFSVSPRARASEVARHFAALSVSAVAVESDAGELVGVLSYIDLLRVLAS